MNYKTKVEKLFKQVVVTTNQENGHFYNRHKVKDFTILITFLSNYDALDEITLWEGLASGKLDLRSLNMMFTQIEIIEEKEHEEGCGYKAKVVGGYFDQLAHNQYLSYDDSLDGIWHLIDVDTHEPFLFPSYEFSSIIISLASKGYKKVALNLIHQISEHYGVDKKLTAEINSIINSL